jgi:hypothetical protein
MYLKDPEELITKADVALRHNTSASTVIKVLNSTKYLEAYAKEREIPLNKLQEKITDKEERIVKKRNAVLRNSYK